METQEQKTPVKDIFLRTVAVLGLIAVLLLGAWGIIQLAVSIPTLFGNIGGGISSMFAGNKQEVLTMSVASTISSGQTLQVSWTDQNQNGNYSYALSYACQNGLSLKAPLPTGAYQAVPCNTPFNFTNATKQTTVVPVLTGSQPMPLTLSISATNLSTGAITASASGSTTVAPASATPTPAQTVKPKPNTSYSSSPSTTYYPATTRPTLYGYGDLAVRIMNVTPGGNGLTAIQFAIENDGTNSIAGGWTFSATLPINGSYMFASQPQQALYPGDKIVYTLTFSRGTQYNTSYNNYPSNYPYNSNQNSWGYTANGGAYVNGGYTCNAYGPCANTSQYPQQYQTQPYNYGGMNGAGTATITADPYNYIQELNKSNNTATATVPLY